MNSQPSYAALRFAIFFAVLLIFFIAEFNWPAWPRRRELKTRRIHNLVLIAIGTVLSRLTIGAWPVVAAYYCQTKGWGLIPFVGLDRIPVVAGLFTYLVLDFAIWVQHYAMHRLAILWPVHVPHHSDPDLDFTTALRFHPFEIMVSLAYKTILVFIFGLTPIGVLIFEILLNAGAIFNHSNLKIPEGIEIVLEKFLVTPRMHRVHHSTNRTEADHNFGFTLIFWDKIFSTYQKKSLGELDEQDIGLPDAFYDVDPTFTQLLLMPLKKTEDSTL